MTDEKNVGKWNLLSTEYLGNIFGIFTTRQNVC